ncbi:MAG TPA: UvrD-helicase domain-containing protein [Cyclobacteriaceae bacterium]
MSKSFHIYRSSAGSGKTRTLAKEYLKLALTSRHDYFKHILAVTFTNKATQEMKDRILFYLDAFANGKHNELAEELKRELGFDDQTFIQNSQEVQSAILHHYSQFGISTIDAFFQKVIRSFTRESGLVGDFRLEVDNEAVLEEVINNLIDELGSNEQLTRWVVDFAKENLENDKAWDVRAGLQAFAEQIFREEFKAIEGELMRATDNPDFFNELLAELKKRKFEFINLLRGKSKEALAIIHANGLTADDFKYGGGVYNLFQKINKVVRVKDFDEKEKGKRIEKEFQDVKHWPDKDTVHQALISKLATDQLLPLLNDILRYWHSHYKSALAAELVLNNFYAFGLIADISRKLNEYKSQNNLMLLADAPKFLNGIIQDSDTPFIYEKVGSFYRNYLIDEFQDTSGYQWKNFLPLLKNSLDQGYRSLVVGDVKQAVYRWRGGDLTLLQNGVVQSVGSDNVEVTELDTNYRSAVNVVDFNNELFKTAAVRVGDRVEHALPKDAFFDVAQKISKTDKDGFVQIEFLQEEEEEDKWKDKALAKVPEYLEQLQSKGIPLKDIAILVRKNDEGQKIATHLLQYKNSEQAKPGCRYDVISNESLRLDGAATVNLLLGAMKYLFNPEDPIARAQLSFEYAKLHEPDKVLSEVFIVSDVMVEHNLPDAFTEDKMALKKLPLFELTETLIEIFKLGVHTGELTYLLAFQDLVLDFYSRERNDLGAFLDWWELNKHKKSIQLSGDVDAVQIFSIHKSKGLQFKYVIIPFCSWSMDHDPMRAPMLWVKGEEAPFTSAGYLPVQYTSTLKETLFSEFYTEEYTHIYLDNLNLLYVAFTRAEFGMLVCAPHPKSSRSYSVAKLLHESIMMNETLQQHWNFAEQRWSKGEMMAIASRETESPDSVSLSHYPVGRWRDKLVIKQSAKGYFNQPDEEKFARISYGVHMHIVLSRLQYEKDIDTTLNTLAFEGVVTEEERESLRVQLQTLVQLPQVANWFSEKWEVKTEVPILLPGGEENRIDRLMLHEKHAIVVDFKTGEPTRADVRQVLDYMNILRQMNYYQVEGYLLYLRNNEIIPVEINRSRPLKKKEDDQQLGLDL